MLQLRQHLEEDIAIATLCPKASLLRWLSPNVATATQSLSVTIATFGGICRNSDALAAIGIMTLICALEKKYFIKNYINVWYHARIRPPLLQNNIHPQLLQNNICPQHSPLALAEQHSPSTFSLSSCRTTFTLSSCRTTFSLSIHPQLLQNNIRPQLLQNGKFLLQALAPIVGLTLFGFFGSIPLDCVRL